MASVVLVALSPGEYSEGCQVKDVVEALSFLYRVQGGYTTSLCVVSHRRRGRGSTDGGTPLAALSLFAREGAGLYGVASVVLLALTPREKREGTLVKM